MPAWSRGVGRVSKIAGVARVTVIDLPAALPEQPMGAKQASGFSLPPLSPKQKKITKLDGGQNGVATAEQVPERGGSWVQRGQ